MPRNFLQCPSRLAGAILLAIALVGCFGCDNSNKTSEKKSVPTTFMDSVEAKMDLNFGQIKQHTVIGDEYFTHSSNDSAKHPLAFRGDTVYYPKSAYPLAIINYHDTMGVGSKKLLFVFNRLSLKNITYLTVATDWDVDYGTNDMQFSYKIINDHLFYVDHTLTERRGREHMKTDKQTVTRRYFTIDDRGNLIRQPEKVVRIKLVAKDESE